MKLIHGDCLIEMQSIPDKSIDMILCDLPYGTTACKWDTVIPFEPLWKQYKRIIKDRGAIVLFGSEPFSSYLRMSNIKDYKYDWIWVKNTASGAMLAKIMPMKSHETISIFGYGKLNYYPQKIQRTENELKRLSRNSVTNQNQNGIYGKSNYISTQNRLQLVYRNPDSVLHFNGVFNRSNEKASHPTQKPVALLEYLIKTYTIEGETVLDNTMGSGSTGVACVNTKRDFIGIELDKTYFDIATKRINEAVGLGI